MTIIGYIGRMGKGKTLSMTRELYKHYLQGYKIISNYHLNFPHRLVDFETLFGMAERQETLDKCVIALDEVHILLDSRSSSSKASKVMTFWLNQTRKMGVKLFFTTQYLHQVDRRLRSGTDILILCDGQHIIKDGTEWFVCNNIISFGDETREEMFVGNEVFTLFDTNQVFKFIDRDKIGKKDGGVLLG